MPHCVTAELQSVVCRYWYEEAGPGAFTPLQLAEVFTLPLLLHCSLVCRCGTAPAWPGSTATTRTR